MSTDTLRIEYVPLEDVQEATRNPKDHDLGALISSIRRFGFVAPAIRDERTGRLVVGHGRKQALIAMQAAGDSPPERVVIDADGRWCIPVVVGNRFRSDADAEAYLIADNRHTELGGWDEPALAEVLASLAQQGAAMLEGVGYSPEDVDDLLAKLTPPSLDALSEHYGDPADDAFWPVVRLRVPQETHDAYSDLMEQMPGARDHERFAALLRLAQEARGA